jgi:hypothetical protein
MRDSDTGLSIMFGRQIASVFDVRIGLSGSPPAKSAAKVEKLESLVFGTLLTPQSVRRVSSSVRLWVAEGHFVLVPAKLPASAITTSNAVKSGKKVVGVTLQWLSSGGKGRPNSS